jgi:hypothetical protein
LTVSTVVPGTDTTLGMPVGWRTATDPDVGLLSVEPGEGRFVASVVVSVDRSQHEALPDPAAAAALMLLAPVVIDVETADDRVDVLICHLAGSISATALQRQVLVEEGLLVVTFTAATSRWSELCDLAREVVDSIGAAA